MKRNRFVSLSSGTRFDSERGEIPSQREVTDVEEKILESLIKRQGIENDESLKDMIQDSIMEMKGYLNYSDDEELPDGCIPAVKQLVLVRYNQDGVEGIASESQSSGGSTTYIDILPDKVKQVIRRYRKFRR